MTLLEDALNEHEKRLEPVLKQATQFLVSMKAWKNAIAAGNVLELQKQAERSARLAESLPGPVANLASTWTFDAVAYLGSDAWLTEIQSVAQQSSHRLLVEGQSVISSPVVVTANPNRQTLRIGTNAWPSLRPTSVIRELKKLRDRGAKETGTQEFVDRMYEATKRLDQNPREGGWVRAKLRDIYELFSIAPGWKKENSEASYAQDLYSLHKSSIRATRGGMKYEWEFPSGQPKPKDVFEIFDESGRPLRYYMIHFR